MQREEREKAQKKEDIETKKKVEENKLVQNVLGLYRTAYDTKAPLHELWEECLEGYTGELFKSNLPEYRSKEVSNFIFSTIETVKPIMLADDPEIIAMPTSPEGHEKAEMVRDALNYEWERTKMFLMLHKLLTMGLIYGTCIIGLFWNGNKDGIGQVEPIPISPFNFFPDPMADEINNGQFAIYATYKSIKDVIEFAPDKEQEIRDNASSPDDKYLTFGKEVDNVKGDQNILYIEAYIKDYTVEIEDYEEEGEQKTRSKMKYPNGRRVVIAGDVLLKDDNNPYNDNGQFPFVTWKCYDVPGKQWGTGEVEQIVSPTMYASAVTNHILETTRLMSNPVWILDKNSGVTKNSLTNRDGLVIRKNPGTEVRREAPPNIPAYVLNLPDMLLNHVEHISGVYDVTRGEKPAGVTAAAAIQALNEQAQGRIRLKVQSMERMLSELGAMWLRRMQQFWVAERQIRMFPEGSEEMQFEGVSSDLIDGHWDIKITAGSTMQSNRTAMAQQLISMAQTPAEDGLPMIDRQTLLENSDIPHVSKIIKRFEAIKEEQQEQQAQMMEAQQLEQEQMMQQQQEQEQMKAQQDSEKMRMQHELDIEKKLVDNDLAEGQQMMMPEEQLNPQAMGGEEMMQEEQDFSLEELQAELQRQVEAGEITEEEMMQILEEAQMDQEGMEQEEEGTEGFSLEELEAQLLEQVETGEITEEEMQLTLEDAMMQMEEAEGEMALQGEDEDLDLTEGEEVDSDEDLEGSKERLREFANMLLEMDPEDLAELAATNPEMKKLIEMIGSGEFNDILG